MTTFEDAKDRAFRTALAVFLRHLIKLVGEDGVARLANTASEHVTMVVAGKVAFMAKVTIEYSEAVGADEIAEQLDHSPKSVTEA